MKYLEIFSLIAGMAGTLLMFFNTKPNNYVTYVYNKVERPLLNAKAKKENQFIKLGLILIGLSFLLQVVNLL